MPKINVYLPDDLADQVKALNLPVSSICQRALEQAARKQRERPPSGGVFQRFDEGARRTIVLCSEHARSLGHNYIGTEHALLALVSDGDSPIAAQLWRLGVTPEVVLAGVEEMVGRGSTPADQSHLPFTPRMKTVLELSLRESLGASDEIIRREHLLLALLRETDGIAAQILAIHGITYASMSMRLRSADPEAFDEASVLPLFEMRLQELREQLNEEFGRVREQLENERERNDQLRAMLPKDRSLLEPAPAPSADRDVLKCSFCGKTHDQVDKVIAGPGVFICNECIALCNEIIDEERPPS